MIADGLLIFASLAAAFYCWMLHRKLSALKRADTGLAARINDLNESIEGARIAIAEAREAAEAEQERLRDIVMEGRLLRAALDKAPKARTRRNDDFAEEDADIADAALRFARREVRREGRR